MAKVIILSGSNSGNRQFFLNEALQKVQFSIGKLMQKSSLYETEPWGFEAEQDFLNQVWMVETAHSPRKVLADLLAIETELGRTRVGSGYSSRIIDLDILYYDDQIIHEAGLDIPHPRIQERNFVLQPLAEILPDFVHPELMQSNSQLLENCVDTSLAKRITV